VIHGPREDPSRAGGEVSQFLRWHLESRPIPVAGDTGRKTRDFVHVEDLATALLVPAGRRAGGSICSACAA
jgi:UDP-glucose 4-epimerase